QGLTKAVTRQSWPPYCAVRAVRIWMESAGITSGPIFRSVAKGGRVSANALAGEGVANIVKAAALRAGLDPARYAGHSLRSGLVTTAARKGASMAQIMSQTGHHNVETVIKYIRKARLFEDTVTKMINLKDGSDEL
ncbi:MAG: tyrosine-type recombinase/integrase, partial [Armatimonadota bacterium]